MNGGIPEYIKSKNQDYLKILYENIIYRDILVRYNLSNEKSLKELMVYLATNVSNQISFNSIKGLFGLKHSTTVKNYIEYLENTYLIKLVPKFDFSLKNQIYSAKKCYLIDNGVANYLGFRFSDDFGRLLENFVFTELIRKNEEIYFYKNKNECDFVIKSGTKIIQAIQVCSEINQQNEKREFEGLTSAMEYFSLNEGLLLSYDDEKEYVNNSSKILLYPAWKWALTQN